jgi:hypothetical protein
MTRQEEEFKIIRQENKLKTPKLQNSKTKNAQNSQEQSIPPPPPSHPKKNNEKPKVTRKKMKTLKL